MWGRIHKNDINYKQTEIYPKSTKTTLFDKKMLCQLHFKTFNQSNRVLLFQINQIYDALILRNKYEYMEGVVIDPSADI